MQHGSGGGGRIRSEGLGGGNLPEEAEDAVLRGEGRAWSRRGGGGGGGWYGESLQRGVAGGAGRRGSPAATSCLRPSL